MCISKGSLIPFLHRAFRTSPGLTLDHKNIYITGEEVSLLDDAAEEVDLRIPVKLLNDFNYDPEVAA
jgi:hypothetical protein